MDNRMNTEHKSTEVNLEYRSSVPARQNNLPEDYRNTYRAYRRDHTTAKDKNVYRKESNYKQYESADEIFDTIVEHLTKGVKFHDKMMDLYGFLGLYGFKKMHEYQYYSEAILRRKVKCYVLDHMNLMVLDSCDEDGLNFIPQSWYDYTRHDITSEARKQYIGPSFQGYKQWEEETKELLSYCANELMYMGDISDFNEITSMIEDVEGEIERLESLMLKLNSVDYDIQYIMDMQESLCEEYEDKLEQCFEEKIVTDRKTNQSTYTSQSRTAQRRSSRR